MRSDLIGILTGLFDWARRARQFLLGLVLDPINAFSDVVEVAQVTALFNMRGRGHGRNRERGLI